MKRCPSCRRVYDRDAEVCQVDGASLDAFNLDPLVGQTIAKRYRLVRRLGAGSLGVVYLAEELSTGSNVAIKILARELRCNDEALKQCRWDARFATASQPSSIARVYEVDRTDEGQVFIAMEYLGGESLADLMRREGALELGRALRLASQIAQGLAAAAKTGVPHRDLKPQNVMVVGPDERVKMTDFGVARLRRTAMGGAAIRPGTTMLEYTAPEQLAGGDADDRTDIYGLGAVLYAMLTGAAPQTAPSPAPAVAHAAQKTSDFWQAPPPIRELRPEVPVALEHALLRAMEREPDRRQSGIHEFAESLLDLAASVIARQTEEAALATRQRVPEPSLHAPRPTEPAVIEPVSPRLDRELEHLGLERRQAARESRRERPQAQRERWGARWQTQWQAYRAQFQSYRERRRVWWLHVQAQRQERRAQLQARHEARLAKRQVRREQWQAYRAQLHAYVEQGRARWQAYRAQVRAQRQEQRAQLQSRLEARRAERQVRRERRQAQWQAYRAQFRAYREQRRARWQANRAHVQAQRQEEQAQLQSRHEARLAERQVRRERRQAQWQAYRAQLRAYVEQGRARWQAYRAHVQAQRQEQRAQLQSRLEARRAQRQERREHRQVQWQAYRAHFRAYREQGRARWQAYRAQLQAQRQERHAQLQSQSEARRAQREVRAAQWQAYRARFQAYRERRRVRWQEYRAHAQAQRQERRAQLQSQLEARRLQRQSRWEQWQARWQTYRAQFSAYQAHSRTRWQDSRARMAAQRQARQAKRQLRWEQWQGPWQAYRAQLQSYRERRRARWQEYARFQSQWHAYRTQRRLQRQQWRSDIGSYVTSRVAQCRARLEKEQSRLADSARRLITSVSHSLGAGLNRVPANAARWALTGTGALVVVGAITWSALDRRGDAPSPVVGTVARDSRILVEPEPVETRQRLAAAPPRRGESEVGSSADRAPSRATPATPAGDDRKSSAPVRVERPQGRDETRANAPAATPQGPVAPAPELALETRRPAPHPTPRAEVEVEANQVRPAPRVVSLSTQQVSRIQTEAEQKLQHRGLLRMSAADRWGVTLETAPTGEITLTGVLRDMGLYAEAVRLVREVPGVREVRGSVEVADVGAVPIVQTDSARIQAEIQQRLRSRGLLRESTADRWGVTVEVSPEGDVTLAGAVRDAEMYREAVRRTQEVPKVRLVKQDIKVVDRGNGQ